MPSINRSILEAALEGLERRQAKIDEQIAHVRWMLRTGESQQPDQAETPQPRKQRRMSAAGRKRIADATRKRWAAYRAAHKA